MAHHYLDESIGDVRPGGTVTITGAEAKHAVTVSRVRAGERLSIGDGAGLLLTGEVLSAESARMEVRVDTVERAPRPTPRLLLAQALAKGDRDELAVQAATELGVDVVVPWQARRSISRWDGPKAQKGRDRWASIVREATKQSIRPWLPEVAELHSSQMLARRAERLVVLDPQAETPITALPLDGRDLLLVVGPEGGIAPEELALFTASGATAVKLGDAVLRTSTAGPAAIAVLSARLARW